MYLNLMHVLPGMVVCVALTTVVLRPSRAQTSGPAANLLSNPSFEEMAVEGVPGWLSRAWSGGADCEWTVASSGRNGGRCVSIRSEKGGDAAWTASVTVQSNALYRLSGWIKTEDVRGAVGALLNIQNLNGARTPPVTGTRDWTRVSTVFRSGDVMELEINCLFGGWGESTGKAWYDDIVLEQVADATGGKPQAILTVHADAPAVLYSRKLFGGFIEHFDRQIYGGLFEPGSPLSDTNGFRKDVIAAMKELKLAIVRWPGGCFASGYHWQDGVGKERKPVADPVWGVDDPNTFGTDEFVAWCRLVGCEPYICANAGNGTPEEMRDWVAYCNRSPGERSLSPPADPPAKPLNVRYWSIGNENWGGHEIGARKPADWGPLVLESARMMRAVDPGITLLAAATAKRDWTLPLLETAGDLLDSVAIHEYWLPCWGRNLTPDYLTCIMKSEGPEATIAAVIALLEESGHRGRIKIAFDEWNLRGWHHPGFPRKQVSDRRDPVVAKLIRDREKNAIAAQYSMADALFSASFLNACLRHADDVSMANIAPIVNTRGPLYVHPAGIVKRTTFHVLAMYANELEGRAVHADMESESLTHGKRVISAVEAIVTVDDTRRAWAIALVNRHPSAAAACTIRLPDTVLDGPYAAIVLAGDSPDAYNDIEHPNRVTPERTQLSIENGTVQLPPHSLTIVKFAAQR